MESKGQLPRPFCPKKTALCIISDEFFRALVMDDLPATTTGHQSVCPFTSKLWLSNVKAGFSHDCFVPYYVDVVTVAHCLVWA